MRYWLELHKTSVAPYLMALPLSRDGRNKVAGFLNGLRDQADSYRTTPDRRLGPGSSYFEVDFVFRDAATGVMHRLVLIVSDAAAGHGVLRVVYAELHGRP